MGNDDQTLIDEYEGVVDQGLLNVVDVKTDAIVAASHHIVGHVEHSPEVEALFPEIADEIGETAIVGDAIGKEEDESSPYEIVSGHNNAE